VQLDTKPPGAQILFVPISQFDGEPDPKRSIKASGVSPIKMELMPGEYWVEAILPDGRFQEVVRHVNKKGSWNEGPMANNVLVAGNDKKLILTPIEIPEKNVIQSMIYVPASESGEAFFLDSHATNVDELNALHYDTDGKKGVLRTSISYQRARDYAEISGKRLLTSQEWDRAQAVLPPRTANDLAEWTRSLELSPDNNSDLVLHGMRYHDSRIVRGGSLKLLEQKSELAPDDYAPRNSIAVAADKADVYPGIAVRCVRSVQPRFPIDH
jgi:hypothetical protein